MRVYFERTGGLMGMRLSGAMDTATMPQKEAIELQHLIMTAANYLEKRDLEAEPPGSVDTFQYRLVVDDGKKRQEYEMTEETAPDEIRPLLRHLTILARSYPDDPEA